MQCYSASGSLNSFNLGASLKRTSHAPHSLSGKPPLGALYDLLISPMEEHLPDSSSNSSNKDLILVLQGELSRLC